MNDTTAKLRIAITTFPNGSERFNIEEVDEEYVNDSDFPDFRPICDESCDCFDGEPIILMEIGFVEISTTAYAVKKLHDLGLMCKTFGIGELIIKPDEETQKKYSEEQEYFIKWINHETYFEIIESDNTPLNNPQILQVDLETVQLLYMIGILDSALTLK